MMDITSSTLAPLPLRGSCSVSHRTTPPFFLSYPCKTHITKLTISRFSLHLLGVRTAFSEFQQKHQRELTVLNKQAIQPTTFAQLCGDTTNPTTNPTPAAQKPISSVTVPDARTFVHADIVNPDVPCWRCVLDTDTLQIRTVDIFESTSARRDREEFPVVYIGDFMEDNGKSTQRIDTLQLALAFIDAVNAQLVIYRSRLIPLNDWSLESALLDLFKSPAGFWSACVHPLDAMGPIIRNRLGSQTKRTRKTNVRRDSGPERAAMKKEHRERVAEHNTNRAIATQRETIHRRVAKCQQVQPTPLEAYLERTHDEFEKESGLRANEQRTQEYAGQILEEWLHGDESITEFTKKTAGVKTSVKAETSTPIALGFMSPALGRDFCRWASDRWGVRLSQLSIATNDKGEHAMFMDDTVKGKIRKSICGKFASTVKSGMVRPDRTKCTTPSSLSTGK